VHRPYTAPERIAGGEWDRRADIFSLAALVHEMIWGRRVAGSGGEAAETVAEVAGGDLPAVRDVFARALAEYPGDRFGTALEFAEALKDAFPGPAVATPAAKGARSVRQPREQELRLPLDDSLPVEVGATPAVGGETARAEAAALPLMAEPAPGSDEAIVPELDPRPVEIVPADLEIRAVETARREDTEVAPEIVAAVDAPVITAPATKVPAIDVPIAREPTMRRDATAPRPEPKPSTPAKRHEPTAPRSEQAPRRVSAIERSRFAVWPIAGALLVGAALGFVAGYTTASREALSPTVAATPPPAAAATVRPAGREGNGAAAAESKERPAAAPEALAAGARASAGQEAPSTAAPPAGRAIEAPAAAEAGRLLVRSTPAGARVFVDGRERGRTPLAIRSLARGAHQVRLARPGYAFEERRIVVTESEPVQSITVTLAREAASRIRQPATPGTVGTSSGSLVIDSLPSGAKVFIDERLVGTTPVLVPEVAVGEHAVRLARDGYQTWSSSVRVVSGERNRVTASLERQGK
jgi:hypothetical protein